MPAHFPPRLHTSPQLVSVLDCVVSDRLIWSNILARRVEVAVYCAATAKALKSQAPNPYAPVVPPSATHDKLTPFHALRAPSVTPSAYLQRLVKHAQCS